MAARPFALDYIEEPSAAGADYGWRLYAFGYATPFLAAIYLWPNRDEPVGWWWLVTAFAWIVVALVLGLTSERTANHAVDAKGTTAPTTMILALSLLVAALAVDVALSPSNPSLRWLFLVPALATVAVGNRVMAVIVAGAAMGAMAITVVAAQPSPIPTIVTDLLVSVLVLSMFRLFAVSVVRSFRRDLLYGSMSEVAATADSLDDGWRRVLPLVAKYLDAGGVTIVERADNGWRVLAAWPEHEPTDLADPAIAGLIDAVTAEPEPLREGGSTAIAVATGDGFPMVALATGAKARPIAGMYQHYRSYQVGLQLSVLVSRLRSLEALAEQTRTDSLTGLPNRRSLMQRLEDEMEQSRRTNAPLSAVMIDLDHFKAFNDRFGHLAGDRALQAVATLMLARLRGEDTICRFGGEEFSMVLPQTDLDGAWHVVEELRLRMRGLDLEVPLTVSIGVAMWDGRESPEALLDRADHALYLAKESGRDQCRLEQVTGGDRHRITSDHDPLDKTTDEPAPTRG